MNNDRIFRDGAIAFSVVFIFTLYFIHGKMNFWWSLLFIPIVFFIELGCSMLLMLIINNYIIDPLKKWLSKGSRDTLFFKKAFLIIPIWIISAFVASQKDILKASKSVVGVIIVAWIGLSVVFGVVEMFLIIKKKRM